MTFIRSSLNIEKTIKLNIKFEEANEMFSCGGTPSIFLDIRNMIIAFARLIRMPR
jgi:hypothetical protein